MQPDDQRLADLARLIRRAAGMTQIELSRAAGVPLLDVKLIERGRASDVKLGRIRRIFEAEEGRVRLAAWWKGAAADRLLDERHAALVERVVNILRSRHWDVHVEVSFSEFGERGSIDVLGLRRDVGVALVLEIKTVIGSLEETNRVFDAKVRLASTIVFKRFGWRPKLVGCALVVPEAPTIRRTIQIHAATMGAKYPARGRDVRSWLRRPSGSLRAIWFLSDGRDTSGVRG